MYNGSAVKVKTVYVDEHMDHICMHGTFERVTSDVIRDFNLGLTRGKGRGDG